jgi:chromosome segregation ATPase
MEASSNSAIDTTEYEEEVEQAQEAIEKLKASEQQLQAEMDDLKPKIDSVKARIDECTLRNEKIVQDMEKAQAEMTQYLESQTQIRDQIEKKRQKLLKYEECIKTHQARIKKMKVTRDDCLLKARKVHFRYQQRKQSEKKNDKTNINDDNDDPGDEMVLSADGDEDYTEPTEEELEAIEPLQASNNTDYYTIRIEKLEKNLKQEMERRKVSREDPHVVFEKYVKAKKDLMAKTSQVDATKATIAAMQSDIRNRKRRWEQFRRHLSKVTDQKFGEMLTMNQYSGDLEFNHENGHLELAVQKNSSHAPTDTKDVKALRYAGLSNCLCFG